MSRNGSGTMSISNSFSSGSTISSSAMNANFTDVASEITNSLPRDGQAAMTGQLKATAGTQAAPGITYGTDTSTGIRRSATSTQRIVAGGTDVVEIGTTGITMQSGMDITDKNSVVVVGMPTGALLMYGATTAPTGWVRANGRTIGNASSSATERANADTSALFTFLWTNYGDSVCAVSGGRGASAAADYAANKTIALPDMRGRAPFGLDDMGASAASRLGTVITSSTTNGASGGTETVTLSAAESGQKAISAAPVTITDPGHSHTERVGSNGSGGNLSVGASTSNTSNSTSINSTSTDTTGITASFTLAGSAASSAHSNMPPAFLVTFIVKL